MPDEVGIVTRMGERVMLTSGSPTISAVEYDYFKQGYAAAAMLDLNVSELAKALHVSRWRLHRRFDEALGKTPQQQINRLRVDYLKRLLSETKIPIAELGTQCGFSDPSHFTRFFKREVC